MPSLLSHFPPLFSLPGNDLDSFLTESCLVSPHRVSNLDHLACPLCFPSVHTDAGSMTLTSILHSCFRTHPSALLSPQVPPLHTLFTLHPSPLDSFSQGKSPGPTFRSSWHLHLLSPCAHFRVTLWSLQAGFYAHRSTEIAPGKAPTNSKG